MVGRIMPLYPQAPDAHILIHRTYGYVRSHDKGELRMPVEIRLLRSNLKVRLSSVMQDGPRVITKIFQSGRWRYKRRSEGDNMRKTRSAVTGFEDGERGPRSF